MIRQSDDETLQLAIPKGRMYDGVARLLAEAGIDLTQTVRNYRPHVNLASCEVKILKPQSIVEMLHAGSRDVGFAGADWVAELDGDLVELVDTGLDPVRVVAAAPTSLAPRGELPEIPIRLVRTLARVVLDPQDESLVAVAFETIRQHIVQAGVVVDHGHVALGVTRRGDDLPRLEAHPRLRGGVAARAREAFVQRHRRFPAKLGLDLRGVDRIAEIVARPVGDEGDQPVMRRPIRPPGRARAHSLPSRRRGPSS